MRGMRDVHSPGGTIDDGVVPFACATDGNGFQRMVPRWAGRNGVGEVGQQKNGYSTKHRCRNDC